MAYDPEKTRANTSGNQPPKPRPDVAQAIGKVATSSQVKK
jgi:hypothetical protein